MFSCGDHSTCAISQNTIAAPTSPTSAASDQRRHRQPAELRRQQVAGAAEPGEKRHERGEVDRRRAPRSVAGRGRHVTWTMRRPRQVHVHVRRSRRTRTTARSSTKPTTKQPRKISGQFMCAPSAAASPTADRPAPASRSSRRAARDSARESACAASRSSAALSAGSCAKRDAPSRSHRSSAVSTCADVGRELGLESRRVADQIPGMHLEEPREQLARFVRQMRPRAASR